MKQYIAADFELIKVASTQTIDVSSEVTKDENDLPIITPNN